MSIKQAVAWKLCSILILITISNSFLIHPTSLRRISSSSFNNIVTENQHVNYKKSISELRLSMPPPSSSSYVYDEEDEEEEDDNDDDDPYTTNASSEFQETDRGNKSESSDDDSGETLTTLTDWGGALSTLRQRIDDVETGKSQNPSQVLFRIMSSSPPTETIRKFVNEANPEIVQAMSGTVQGMLGGLSNPMTGIETIVTANSDKLSALCFQLQMTGYMFRNAEYVVALKQLMKIKSKNGGTTLPEYKKAFDRLDIDSSGYIDISEVETLLSDVYDNNEANEADTNVPKYEIQAFMNHFDTNNDNKISWKEFEEGLGAMKADSIAREFAKKYKMPSIDIDDDYDHDEDEDDEDYYPGASLDEPTISGIIEIEIGNGKFIEVEASDYIADLKKEAQELKEALLRERGGGDLVEDSKSSSSGGLSASEILGAGRIQQQPSDGDAGSITNYLVTLGSDISTLTKGISPEVVDTMKLLVDFVLNNKNSSSSKDNANNSRQRTIPGIALQQLAFWQLVLGYKLREAEATGDYRNMLE